MRKPTYRDVRFFVARWRLPLRVAAVLAAITVMWIWREHHVRDDALSRAGLAPIPSSAEFTYTSVDGGFLFDEMRVSFKAPPDDVVRWWNESPNAPGATTPARRIINDRLVQGPEFEVPTLMLDRTRTYHLAPSPRNVGASVTVSPNGTVDIYVFAANHRPEAGGAEKPPN